VSTLARECPYCGRRTGEDANFCPACGRPLRVARETRKTATVVFCDLAGSTEVGERLDPEVFHRVMSRFYEVAQRVLRGHGGTVGPLEGDGCMTVFGIPVANEDDAMRAVRATVELRDALRDLETELDRDFGVRLHARTGVNTGEVVDGGAGLGQPYTAGDTVNVAARLEQAAQPGEILLGEATLRLVRDAVEVEGVAPLVLKGKSNLVPAFRLLGVVPGAPGRRRPEVPLVGRSQELALLHLAFARAVRERSCHLVTVLGAAGVGKTRLADELAAAVGDRATVLRGRCLSYGAGVITYYPITRMISEAAGIATTTESDVVVERLAALVADENHAERIVRRVAQVLAATEGTGSPEDTYWAVRRVFQVVARRRPLIMVVDDLHWAEPTMLDVLDHLVDWSRDAPILLLCLARPELLDRRPSWAGGRRNALTMQLSPLSGEEAERLLGHLLGQVELPARERARAVHMAEGNPLFLVELVAALLDEAETGRDAGDGRRPRVPPPVEALLAARLDRLEPDERAVLERAAVVGQRFFRSAVQALVPDELRPSVGEQLAVLRRKELIRADSSALLAPVENDGRYRFFHGLLRDTVYRSIPKETRAELHERYASWLEEVVGEQRSAQFAEIVVLHLEEALRYRRELGPAAADLALARRTGVGLASAAHHALDLGDLRATRALARRAVELLPLTEPARLVALFDRANALRWSARFAEAREAYDEAIRTATVLGDEVGQVRATLGGCGVMWYTDLDGVLERGRREAERAVGVFERLGDDLGLARAWRLIAEVESTTGHTGPALEAADRALELARRAGNERWEARIVLLRCQVLAQGPAPLDVVEREVSEALAWSRSTGARRLEAAALIVLARSAAMRERFDEARALLAAAGTVLDGLGDQRMTAAMADAAGMVTRLAGDLAAAETALREGCNALARLRMSAPLPGLEAALARVLLDQGRDEEAEALARRAGEAAADGDLETQLAWRGVVAVALARTGRAAEALALAREAVARGEGGDKLNRQADASLDLAATLLAAGEAAESATAAQVALDAYRRKGNQVGARAATTLLASLASA
jgi:class 3 adenylate cyclase/tetratricopeptide (TPR) repeat protein